MADGIVTVERSSIARVAQAKDRPEKPYEVRADKPVGLILRVQPTGSRTYYVQVSRQQRVRIGPAGVFTLKQAIEKANEILRDPESARKRVGTADTLGAYIDLHYEPHALAKLKNGAESVARVKAVWQKLLSKRIADITANMVDKMRNDRLLEDIAPATVNRDVSALSGIFSHWVRNNKGTVHPLADLEPLAVADDETIRYLTPDEARRLRQALAERDAAAAAARASANEWRLARGKEPYPEISGYSDHMTPMVLLSLNTGLRRGELFSLKWDAVDMRLRTLTVLASHSKGNKTRHIPLNTEAMEVLTKIRPANARGLVFRSPVVNRGEPEPPEGWPFNNVSKAWAEITKAAGIPDFRWHDLRHDFASQLVMGGISLYMVQQLLGHSNAQMTQRYARLAPSTLADAVSTLRPISDNAYQRKAH